MRVIACGRLARQVHSSGSRRPQTDAWVRCALRLALRLALALTLELDLDLAQPEPWP